MPVDERLIQDQALVDGSPRADPWDNPWRIECDDGRVAVASNGKDRKPGTEDDIRVPSPAKQDASGP